MYEIVFKWALDLLGGLAKQSHNVDLDLVVEAMRAKNALVQKRFEFAWFAAQDMGKLEVDVIEGLDNWDPEIKKEDSSIKSFSFLNALEQQFHPAYYRRLRAVRAAFEATCDVLAAYSLQVQNLLNFRSIKSLITASCPDRPSDIKRSYLHLWSSATATMFAMMRITSTDIRFWLSELPHLRVADKWAQEDIRRLRHYTKNKDSDIFYLSLESTKGLEKFWEEVESIDNKSFT